VPTYSRIVAIAPANPGKVDLRITPEAFMRYVDKGITDRG